MMTRTKLLLASAALVILLASAVAGFWLTRDGAIARADNYAATAVADADADADDAQADLVRQDQPIYYTIDPPLVVNLQGLGGVLQVGVSLSTHYASVNEALKNDDPAIRSAILLALSDVEADAADTDASKRALLATIPAVVNRQLAEDGYKGSVEGAYFTSFIVQPSE